MTRSSNPELRIEAGCSIAAALNNIQHQSALSQQEIRILVGHVLQLSRVQLITQSERCLSQDEAQRLASVVARRIAGEPIAYLIGEREFYGLSLRVTPAVLIPRPETELLVELALRQLPHNGQVLDMGTGSGAIAVAIAKTRPDAQVTALDLSDDALDVARHNASRHGCTVTFLQSDWFSALPADCRFDLIVANPPYIVSDDPHLSQGDLRFEPHSALTDGGDGLACLRSIIAGADSYLRAGGQVLLEHGYDQAPQVRQLLNAQGFINVQSRRDLSDIERVTIGQKA